MQFWRELREQRCVAGGSAERSPAGSPALYRRDKALSCSTGLELSPRPRTCIGVPPRSPDKAPDKTPDRPPEKAPEKAPDRPPDRAPDKARGKLDKSHSTPAYDSDAREEPGALAAQPIPESPSSPDSPALQPPHHTVNAALLERRAREPPGPPRRRAPSPPPRPQRAPPAAFPALRAVPRAPPDAKVRISIQHRCIQSEISYLSQVV